MNIVRSTALLGAVALAASVQASAHDDGQQRIEHVLLISIDGMHALDFLNCADGVSTIDNGAPYCPHLAELKHHGLNYLEASTSRPSDSFPGLMAIVTGGSPRTYGAFYDVAYDRSLATACSHDGQRTGGGYVHPAGIQWHDH
jgi:predicted AlkP superfamily pyrophosphatase or phosphodiesterase